MESRAALRKMWLVNETFGEMLDTSPAQRRRYYDWLRSLTPQERAREAEELSEAGRELACAGIRASSAARSFARQLVERLYGNEIAARFFPADE